MSAEAVTAFLYGKMPAHGDFVARGLAPAGQAAWDGWLATGMLAARDLHGAAFDDLYAEAPVWRFVIAGEGGEAPAAGALACSVDAVGRRFPLLCGVHAAEVSEALAETCEDRLYEAFAEGWTADRLQRALAEAATGPAGGRTGWWTEGNEAFAPAECAGRRPAGLIGKMLMMERGA